MALIYGVLKLVNLLVDQEVDDAGEGPQPHLLFSYYRPAEVLLRGQHTPRRGIAYPSIGQECIVRANVAEFIFYALRCIEKVRRGSISVIPPF
jgi:hypothetical protein